MGDSTLSPVKACAGISLVWKNEPAFSLLAGVEERLLPTRAISCKARSHLGINCGAYFSPSLPRLMEGLTPGNCSTVDTHTLWGLLSFGWVPILTRRWVVISFKNFKKWRPIPPGGKFPGQMPRHFHVWGFLLFPVCSPSHRSGMESKFAGNSTFWSGCGKKKLSCKI